jgi:hypothetical protein
MAVPIGWFLADVIGYGWYFLKKRTGFHVRGQCKSFGLQTKGSSDICKGCRRDSNRFAMKEKVCGNLCFGKERDRRNTNS